MRALYGNTPAFTLMDRLSKARNVKDFPGTVFPPGGVAVQPKGAPVVAVGMVGASSRDPSERFTQAGVATINE
ncbi:hypothetical protein IPZ58_30860 [Streptomyces roseoverticillatus]|uniref:hypothetical protein n=1 Tax=Streptomyces roseoverticillatus TaxID=66429 RepID=UPI001F28F47B|nr:hypothetical protein [Streptomyces roseoverticillatus]MCF3105945.1 hypothetical protein [Streptomyces roseoverticillatus]